jgi:hypothetical protein
MTYEIHDGQSVIQGGFETLEEANNSARGLTLATGLDHFVRPEGSLEKEEVGEAECVIGVYWLNPKGGTERVTSTISVSSNEVKPRKFATGKDQKWDYLLDPFASTSPPQKAEAPADADEMRIDYLFAPMERAIQVAWPDEFLDAMIMQAREEKAQAQLLALQELETQTHITCGSKSRGGKDNE